MVVIREALGPAWAEGSQIHGDFYVTDAQRWEKENQLKKKKG